MELTAIPTLAQEHWLPLLHSADALLVGGGESFYLCYWIHQTGLAGILPSLLHETVYVGASAGSTLVTPAFRGPYDGRDPLTGSDKALGLVDFLVRPHLDAEYMPVASLATIEAWAAEVTVPAYAIDDETALKVIDGVVEVMSEGHWKLFTPTPRDV